jgi:hypothetical protein
MIFGVSATKSVIVIAETNGAEDKFVITAITEVKHLNPDAGVPPDESAFATIGSKHYSHATSTSTTRIHPSLNARRNCKP